MSENSQPVRVMICDDNRLVAEAIELRLKQDSNFTWLGWASGLAGLIERVQELRPDVLLLDIDLPGPDPFEVLQQLSDQVPNVRTIMFSGYVRADYIERAIECGAWGYISKNDSIRDLLQLIQDVAAGEFVLSREVAAQQSQRP
jgi:two-component system response regulator DesR